MTADSELLVMFFKITFPAAIGKTDIFNLYIYDVYHVKKFFMYGIFFLTLSM